jgi:ABC-2 type transport system permease protein|uniref:ABC transporter permease n=1 Tax=Desulfobacca acetoxidans TaxID=60893 RepID=A0A7C5AL49_9BACT
MNLLIELNKIWAFAARSLIVNRRNVFAVFEMLFWPGVSIFSVGLLTRFLKLDQETVTFVLIGAVSMNTIQIAQLDLSYCLLYDVWSKSLRHEFMAPIRLGHLLGGAGLVGVLRGFLVFVIMGLLSTWLFDMDLTRPGLAALTVFLTGMFLNAAIIGILVLVLVLRFGHRAEVAAWAFSYLLLLLCGLYYPVSVLPPGIQELAKFIPLTYFLEYFRHFYGFPLLSPHPLFYGYAQSVLYLLASYGLLLLTLHSARKRGILLKLSE